MKVVNLDGSIFEWANEGRPLDGDEAGGVHPYNRVWGQALRGEAERRGVSRV